MSNRLDKDREAKLQPERINFAVKTISDLGYEILVKTSTYIEFEHIGDRVRFFPYSGWHTGKSIKDGRGLEKLIKQLKG